jgi:hypothetical protein
MTPTGIPAMFVIDDHATARVRPSDLIESVGLRVRANAIGSRSRGVSAKRACSPGRAYNNNHIVRFTIQKPFQLCH